MLGLRKGEVLGLARDEIDLETDKLSVGWQVPRVPRQLLRRETKTEASDATLPPPDICATALRLRRDQQDQTRVKFEPARQANGLVFTTWLAFWS